MINFPLKEWYQFRGTVSNCKQFRGYLKVQWGEIIDDPFDIIAGKRENLAGKVQEAHGISRGKMEGLL